MTTGAFPYRAPTLYSANSQRQSSAIGDIRLLIFAAVMLRLILATISIGSNDATTFFHFTTEIRQHGLMMTYSFDPDFNHPPLAAMWAMFCRAVAGDDVRLFCFVFKLPPIAADGACVYLLWKIVQPVAPRMALLAAAGFAFSLDAILVSGFHCNTDSCYALFCLLSVYLIERHGRWFWGGLALAAAINTKLIPTLLIPPLLLSCRSFRDATRFTLGLSIGVLPFLAPLYVNPSGFAAHVLNYGSLIDRWGISFFIMSWKQRAFDPHTTAGRVELMYATYARTVILLAILAWGLIARNLKRWNRYELCAVTFAIFLILTPGYGRQYTTIIGALLFAAAPRIGLVYALSSGVFLVWDYFTAWDGRMPIYSNFTNQLPIDVALLGVMVWMVLVVFLIRTVHAGVERRELV